MQAIASAAEEQSASVEVVRRSIQDIKSIAEQTSEATKDTETVVHTLVGIAGSLDGIVAGMTEKEDA